MYVPLSRWIPRTRHGAATDRPKNLVRGQMTNLSIRQGREVTAQDAVAPEDVVDQAYAWLCGRRREAPFWHDVWHLRWRWADLMPTLRQQLLDGSFRLGPACAVDGGFGWAGAGGTKRATREVEAARPDHSFVFRSDVRKYRQRRTVIVEALRRDGSPLNQCNPRRRKYVLLKRDIQCRSREPDRRHY